VLEIVGREAIVGSAGCVEISVCG